MTDIISFHTSKLVETLSQKTGMLEGEIEEILDRIKIKSELKIKGVGMTDIKVNNALIFKWQRDGIFTIKFCTESDEERSRLLDAMRDRTRLTISIEIGDKG